MDKKLYLIQFFLCPKSGYFAIVEFQQRVYTKNINKLEIARGT